MNANSSYSNSAANSRVNGKKAYNNSSMNREYSSETNSMMGGRRKRNNQMGGSRKRKNNSSNQMGGRRRSTRKNQMGGQNNKMATSTQMGNQMGGSRRRSTRKNQMGGQNNKMAMPAQMGGAHRAVGSHAAVWHGSARHTSGGLTKKDLMKNKHGRIVSKKKHALGKKALKHLVKAGFKAKKGTFKLFR